MSDPTSDEVTLPSTILPGQKLITEFFSCCDAGTRQKRSRASSEKIQAKKFKSNDNLETNDETGLRSTSPTKGRKVSFDPKNGNSVKCSVVTRSKARPSVSDSSFELSRRKADVEQEMQSDDEPPKKSYTMRVELSGSSDERDSDSGERPGSNTTNSMNLEFYRNKIRSVPDGDFIEVILEKWKDDFGKLEQHHGYIQWLFPIRESGMNSRAQVLKEDEAKAIRNDPVLKERLLRAYKLMLNFYGMKLLSNTDGTVGPSKLYRERMEHLNTSFHNNLRITRILKALGELGFEHFKKPLVTFLVQEAFQKNTLVSCRKSCISYWIPTIVDEKERKELDQMVTKFKEEGSRWFRRNQR